MLFLNPAGSFERDQTYSSQTICASGMEPYSLVFSAVQRAFEKPKHLVLRERYLRLVTTTLASGRLQNKLGTAQSGALQPWAGCSLGVGVGTPAQAAAMWIHSVVRAGVFTSKLTTHESLELSTVL